MTTLRDDIAADVFDVILDTDEFAETVDYFPGTAPKRAIRAVVVPGNDISEEAQRDGLMAINDWRVVIASDVTNGIVNPQHGDRIKQPSTGKTMIVVGRDNNGFGAHVLTCREVRLVEKSAQDHRIER